jgi:hypothetical protein
LPAKTMDRPSKHNDYNDFKSVVTQPLAEVTEEALIQVVCVSEDDFIHATVSIRGRSISSKGETIIYDV